MNPTRWGYVFTALGFCCVALALISPTLFSVARAVLLIAVGLCLFRWGERRREMARAVLKDLEFLLSSGLTLGILVGLTHPYVDLWEGLYGGGLLWLAGRAIHQVTQGVRPL